MSSRHPTLLGLGGAALVAALLVSVAWWPVAQLDDKSVIAATPAVSSTTVPSTTVPSTTVPAIAAPPALEVPPASAALTPSPPGEPDLAWGPTAAEWRAALAAASALPLDAAAGQVIVASVLSPSPDATEDLVAELGLGGVIVMGDAVTDADGVRALTAAAQRGAHVGERDWGALVGVDQEGGTVARLQGIVPDLPGFMAAGAARDKGVVERVYRESAVDMRALGVTMDFAPVADMTIGLADPTIRTRSAGDDVDNVSATVATAVKGYVAGGVVPVVKHFPGHGSVTVDSHTALPRQSASFAALEDRDLVPFARAVEAGVPAVMMGHIALDEWGGMPATLSPEAYAYLRDGLGFDGVVATDALDMRAITDAYSGSDAAVAALAAGADLLLMPADPIAARDAIVEAVESGEIARERLDEAVTRIIALQRWQRGLGPVVDLGTNYGLDLAVAGATVASGDCDSPLVSGAVEVVGGRAVDRDRLVAGLVSHGVDAVAAGQNRAGDRDNTASREADEPVTTVAFAGSGSASETAEIAIATGSPWVLEGSSARTLVALYGRSDDALTGLADVLAGAAAPGGTWPVDLDVSLAVCG